MKADLFKRLWENGVIGEYRADRPGSMTYEEFVKKQTRLIYSRWWVTIALLFVALYWLYECFFVHNSQITYAPLWLRLIMIFVFSVTGYGAVLSIVWLLIIVVASNRLFHVFRIRVKPLHPDGSGGLGLFNRFLWISVTLMTIGVCGALASTPRVSSSFDIVPIITGVVYYIIIAPLLLMAWFVLPHHVMIQERNKLLQPVACEYERAVSEMMSEALDDAAAISAGTERLAALQKRYDQIRNSFPTWPIEIVQLRQLAIVWILPLLLSLLPLLFDAITKQFGRG